MGCMGAFACRRAPLVFNMQYQKILDYGYRHVTTPSKMLFSWRFQMAVKQRSYGTANFVLSALAIFSWIEIAFGVVLMLLSIGNLDNRAAGIDAVGILVVSFFIIIVGILSLALVQIGRAIVHNAEINWEILVLMRGGTGPKPSLDKLDGSKDSVPLPTHGETH